MIPCYSIAWKSSAFPVRGDKSKTVDCINQSSNLDQPFLHVIDIDETFVSLQDFSKRILVATNLFGRGMDIERVNIVFNYDMPEDSDTYLHRVARAGRFGTKGWYYNIKLMS